MNTVANVLFGVGLFLSVLVTVYSWFMSGEDKRGVVASPFMFFLASVIAHYLAN